MKAIKSILFIVFMVIYMALYDSFQFFKKIIKGKRKR